MSKPIIEVKNLSKLYRLGVIGATSLHESLERWWCRARGKEELCREIGAKNLMISPNDPQAGPEPNTIWALNNISLSVNRGEVLGVIGRNGAGKSTLLKILSRITEPTGGKAIVRGRISSLLEVGTGFHPDLTGRENVYLNGAILGMRKLAIGRKFDAIVAFAEMEKFIDTPVKRYSSGMYVRLAFAVAAHLDSEILLVDEVLAVGDTAFQKKCLGKMEEAVQEKRTVLFVSHNLAAIISLCPRSILLDSGRLVLDEETQKVTSYYHIKSLAFSANDRDLSKAPRKGNGKVKFISIDIKAVSSSGSPLPIFQSGCDMIFETEVECYHDIVEYDIDLIIYDYNNYRLMDINTVKKGIYLTLKNGKKANIKFVVQEVLLRSGEYYVGLWVGKHGFERCDYVEHAARFTVEEKPETIKQSLIFPGPYICEYNCYVI